MTTSEGRPRASLRGLPPGWIDFSLPSKLDGVEITHLKALASENEFDYGASFSVSLLRKDVAFETRSSTGAWNAKRSSAGWIHYMPPFASGRTRFLAPTEAINVTVNLSWLADEEASSFKSLVLSPVHAELRDRALTSIIEDIAYDNLEGSAHGVLYSESLVLAAVHRFRALALRREALPRAFRADLAIERAVDYMQANLVANLTLRAIMQASDWNGGSASFIRAFKLLVGMAPHVYLREMRLQEAARMLTTSRIPIGDIASRCGFSSLSHFSATFKQKFTMAPNYWRRTRR